MFAVNDVGQPNTKNAHANVEENFTETDSKRRRKLMKKSQKIYDGFNTKGMKVNRIPPLNTIVVQVTVAPPVESPHTHKGLQPNTTRHDVSV